MNIAKFKVGDMVVCVDDDYAEGWLTKGESYIVDSIADYEYKTVHEYYLRGVGRMSWMGSRFELFDEWAKHQKPVEDKVELELTKLQVKQLQDSRKDLQASLELAKELLQQAYETSDDASLVRKISKFLEGK